MDPLNSSVYPRIYRTSGSWLCVHIALALLFCLPGLGLGWLFLSTGKHASGFFGGLFLSGVLVLVGLSPIVSALKVKVVLDADRIETQALFSTRLLQRSEILGRRAVRDRGGTRHGGTWLIPRGEDNWELAEKRITISCQLRADRLLREWVDSLPDLDAPERRASEEEILSGVQEPSDREARMRQLAHAKVLCRCLIALVAIAGVWTIVFPNRFVVLLLALLPWLAVVITRFSGGLIQLLGSGNFNDAHADLSWPVILPGVVLLSGALRGLIPLEAILGMTPKLMTPEQGLTPATWIWIGLGIVVGLCLLAAALAADSSVRKNAAITVLLLPLFLEYGIVAVGALRIPWYVLKHWR